jgi:hypothetical protein
MQKPTVPLQNIMMHVRELLNEVSLDIPIIFRVQVQGWPNVNPKSPLTRHRLDVSTEQQSTQPSHITN